MTSSPSISSCPPSSSAVTIPIPGKSILKRPPPPQQSLFSRITRLLPAQSQPSQTNNDETKPLKRAHFILPHIAIVYPISSLNPPSTPTLKDEKQSVEEREAERRRRVVRGNSVSTASGETEEWWNMEKVESFYRECCGGCGVVPDPAISNVLKRASSTGSRLVDLSGVQLNVTSASILSDVFTIEWGLRRLVFRECDLSDQTLKPMLHALLIPNTLTFLSVASNRGLKTNAFRFLGAFLQSAKALEFLDLSQNVLDKKAMEYIVASLGTASEPGVASLRFDDCSLKPAAIEVLCRAVRTSSLKHISLRHNRISPGSGVALALMIRDYPDVVPQSSLGSTASSLSSSPSLSLVNLPAASPPATPTAVTPTSSIHSNILPPPTRGVPVLPSTRNGPVLPPPRHPTSVPLQTTYTPYVPRSRRGQVPTMAPNTNPWSASGQPIPIITSSSQGGVTTRHPVNPVTNTHLSNGDHARPRHDAGPSAALLDKVRALDNLPRVGALRTLDLRGNDLRTGVTYVAQVLKRNRTLKVLNLSENKLDVQALVALAEALKYNACLETLDLSRNPCAGPTLEGIQSLRTAFTLNSVLKRLFLASTGLTSAGAIALAEFLPESTSLLHLDLTSNVIDLAGVMALNSGLKANHTMRCLDLNIPPLDEAFARQCREILSSCVRNTEEAAASGHGKQMKSVWGMIEESELAKSIRAGDELVESDVAVRARSTIAQLTSILDELANAPPSTPILLLSPNPANIPKDEYSELRIKGHAIVSDLTNVIQQTEDPVRMEELFEMHEQVSTLLNKLPPPPRLLTRPQLMLPGLGLTGANGVNGSTSSLVSEISSLGLAETEEDMRSLEEDILTTPRIDKGKARAEPEPEEPEKVLSPTFMITADEDEEDEERSFNPAEEGEPSPTNRSKSWVEEEGEVFRKGQILLGPEEMEGEYAGEDLKRELLEAMVERAPPRPITDEFGVEIPAYSRADQEDDIVTPLMSPTLPQSPSVLSTGPFSNSSPSMLAAPLPPIQIKAPPKPYISRRSSNSSILGVISPLVRTGSLNGLSPNASCSNSPRVSAPPSPLVLQASTLPGSPMLGPSLSRNRDGSGSSAFLNEDAR